MSVFDNITKKVTDTAKAAAKKSGELVEITKLNLSTGSEEDKIEKAYIEVGKIVFESYSRGEETAAAFKEQCEKIKGYNENIRVIKEKILELKNITICPGCKAELPDNAVFCSKCGSKLG